MKKRKKIQLRRIDYLLIGVISVMALAWPIIIVYANAAVSASNIEVERMRRNIDRQETINEGLTMQVNELASLTNIQEIARQHGIRYNNDNIIIVQ